MTDLNAIIQQVRQHLAEAGIGSADTEAASIAAHVLQVDRGRLGVLQVLGQSIAQSTSNQIWALVEARKRRIPLQHLTGVAGFYGLDIQTGPGVFIPRPETEIVDETTLQQCADATGCLNGLQSRPGGHAMPAALAEHVARESLRVALWAGDWRAAAEEWARNNAAPYNATVLDADGPEGASIVPAHAQLDKLLGK